MTILHLYRKPGLLPAKQTALLSKLAKISNDFPKILSVSTETCFNVEIPSSHRKSVNDWKSAFGNEEAEKIRWLLSETFEPEYFSHESWLLDSISHASENGLENAIPEKRKLSSYRNSSIIEIIEVGPRLSYSTSWCSNAMSIFKSCGIKSASRIERSMRYRFEFSCQMNDEDRKKFLRVLHDRMTEMIYTYPLETFDLGAHVREPVREVKLLEEGQDALKKLSNELGLGFDDWDIEFYTKLFTQKMKRNPTDVECFDLAQSNSEHCRHWFFGGRLIVNGVEEPETLFQLVKSTIKETTNPNSIIAFKDNSSAIRGYTVVRQAVTSGPAHASEHKLRQFGYTKKTVHGLLTCETHNFPCGIAPFPGAETGTGGRIRDVQATGRGAEVVAGTAAYCVGNLRIPGYDLPWEDADFLYPDNMASPLQIIIDASNGASDYGNKFGEPVICGYTRSFGMRLGNTQERREWIKPIMMTAGVGLLNDEHVSKLPPQSGMTIVKVGGPAFRIGLGGGAASSKSLTSNVASSEPDLDFNAVQRGDAEMENKMNRVIKACVDLGDKNPILSIHDQGAGGNGNVLKEIAEPLGSELILQKLPIADKTMSVRELWGAEYQENNAMLIAKESEKVITELCERENCPYGFVGIVTDTGRCVVFDDDEAKNKNHPAVDLYLEDVLGKMPQKIFKMNPAPKQLEPFDASTITLSEALKRVLRLLSVGSKRFLTNKVDRCVSGLVAQQQCVGPLQTPLSDFALISETFFPNDAGKFSGVATAIGECAIKGLVDPEKMARLAVCEALTNLIWVKISHLKDVKCSGNWMWAAKMPGEGYEMLAACKAMRDAMKQLGIGIDGGKDSLSMVVKAPKDNVSSEVVKAPGELVLSVYAMVPDLSKKVTADIKPIMPQAGAESLIFINLSNDRCLGGTSFAHVFGKLGNVTSDVYDLDAFTRAFHVVQELIQEDLIVAGHDISDGGLITAILEMAFAGKCGLSMLLSEDSVAESDLLSYLFNEGCGLLIQPAHGKSDQVMQMLGRDHIPTIEIAAISSDNTFKLGFFKGDEPIRYVYSESMTTLRMFWEETSFELEKLQADIDCVMSEHLVIEHALPLKFNCNFDANVFVEYKPSLFSAPLSAPRVAIIREEGSNGDREMAAAFNAAGFQTFDLTMSDFSRENITLSQFKGIAFVGGFSFGDVLDSAKGWAAVMKFHPSTLRAFEEFYRREDTFSLGICNGCQLMALLGWVPGLDSGLSSEQQPRFFHNKSGRHESRFLSVKIPDDTKAIMLDDMEGSTLGVWVSHGEGRAMFPDPIVLDRIKAQNQIAMYYADSDGNPTETYPFNPNGSTEGIAGLSSSCGRHLALMPHVERSFRKWQWAYWPTPEEFVTPTGDEVLESPWMRMFHNARLWCEDQED